jgi:hypothetical protein
LADAGASVLRLSPQYRNMAAVVGHFRDALEGQAVDPASLRKYMYADPCDGYWLGKAGLDYLPNQAAG